MNSKQTIEIVLGIVGLGVGLFSSACMASERQIQESAYESSIKVNERDSGERGEAARLAHLAKINSVQATTAAQAQVPGTVLKVELDNENGNLVYSVGVKTASNEIKDVKVDAGNGKVLHVDSGDEDDDSEKEE
jgi:uncharacterized membrane protein YkoI